MALEIWYQQTPANDLSEGDPAIVVTTVEELDAFVDRVLSDGASAPTPPMIEVSTAGVQTSAVLQVGLGPRKGFIAYLAQDSGATSGDRTLDGTATYDFAGNVSEVPASVEVPIDVVRQGLREFMETGGKPSSVQ